MADDVEGPARRLLRALNENQAHGREGAVEKPAEEETIVAGLRPGSHLYRAAVWWLLDNEALVPDWEANARVKNRAGAQYHDFAFRLTPYATLAGLAGQDPRKDPHTKATVRHRLPLPGHRLRDGS